MSGMPDNNREMMNERQLKLLRLKDARQVIETLNQDVTQYFAPWLGRYPGDDMKPDQLHGQRMDRILDSTTLEALEIAQNGMNSGLTPSSRPWYFMRYKDDGLNKFGKSRDWMDKLTAISYSVLRKSGFYQAMHASYGEVLLFANGCIAKNRYPTTGLRYKDLTFGEYWLSSSAGGKVDTLFRSRWMTARQIVDQFGENAASAQVVGDLKKAPYNAYEIIHCVQPRKERVNGKNDPKHMPFESIWWENMSAAELSAQQSMASTQAPHFLRESGFKSFPYYVPRWKVTGSDNYGGACPGIKQLGEAKYLQDLKESMIIAVHKELDPPVLADDSYRGLSIRTGAGGITYGDLSTNPNMKKLQALYEVKANIQAGKMLMDDSKTAIKNGFFNNLFLTLLNLESQADRVTAKQIAEMKAQGLLQLGPFIEHVTEDVFNDLILGVVEEILEFPEWYGLEPAPQDLQGKDFRDVTDIVYTSMLAQAQREMGKSAIDEMLATVSANSTVWPDALDLVDVDSALRERAELIGVPSKMMRSEDVVQAIRDRRAKELKQKEAMEQAQAGVEAASKLANAPTDPQSPNALLNIAGMFSGGATQ